VRVALRNAATHGGTAHARRAKVVRVRDGHTCRACGPQPLPPARRRRRRRTRAHAAHAASGSAHSPGELGVHELLAQLLRGGGILHNVLWHCRAARHGGAQAARHVCATPCAVRARAPGHAPAAAPPRSRHAPQCRAHAPAFLLIRSAYDAFTDGTTLLRSTSAERVATACSRDTYAAAIWPRATGAWQAERLKSAEQNAEGAAPPHALNACVSQRDPSPCSLPLFPLTSSSGLRSCKQPAVWRRADVTSDATSSRRQPAARRGRQRISSGIGSGSTSAAARAACRRRRGRRDRRRGTAAGVGARHCAAGMGCFNSKAAAPAVGAAAQSAPGAAAVAAAAAATATPAAAAAPPPVVTPAGRVSSAAPAERPPSPLAAATAEAPGSPPLPGDAGAGPCSDVDDAEDAGDALPLDEPALGLMPEHDAAGAVRLREVELRHLGSGGEDDAASPVVVSHAEDRRVAAAAATTALALEGAGAADDTLSGGRVSTARPAVDMPGVCRTRERPCTVQHAC
jgi:hypothetical protein